MNKLFIDGSRVIDPYGRDKVEILCKNRLGTEFYLRVPYTAGKLPFSQDALGRLLLLSKKQYTFLMKKKLTKADRVIGKELLKECAVIIESVFKEANIKICSACPSNSSVFGGIKVGCCCGCSGASGHFDTHDKSAHRKIRALKAQYNFDEKIFGFFDPIKKCCGLPREKRSFVCTRFACENVVDSLVTTENFRWTVDKHARYFKMLKDKLGLLS